MVVSHVTRWAGRILSHRPVGSFHDTHGVVMMSRAPRKGGRQRSDSLKLTGKFWGNTPEMRAWPILLVG